MTNFFHVAKNSLVKEDSITKRKWLRFVGLTAIELILVTILALPFLGTIAAHPALPEDLEHDLQMTEPVEMGPQADLFQETAGARATLPDDLEHDLRKVEPAEMGPKFDPSSANNGLEAAMIPAFQGTPTTTLSISIRTSAQAVVDSNLGPGTGSFPELAVIAAAVSNTGAEDAKNVEVVLDYGSTTAPWKLANGESPTRSIKSMAPGTIEWVYWFAGYISDTETTNVTHVYTVTADGTNTDPVSTSDNSYIPGIGYTISTSPFNDNASQGFAGATFTSTVGVVFTMTENFDTSNNPDVLILGPIGNADYDASRFRLTSVYGRFLSGTVELGTWTDAVSVTVPSGTIQDNIDSVEVNYGFVPILPGTTRACSYMGIVYFPNTRQYDINYCDNSQIINFNNSLALSLTKTVDKVDAEQGENLLYTITYTNNATETVGSMWIWDDVPSDVSILTGTISTPAGATYDESESSDTRASWQITNLAPSDSGTIQFSVLVDGNGADIADGTVLTNEANLAIIVPSLAADAYRVLSDTVTTTVHAPTITMTKTVDKSTAVPGDTLTYVIEITNTGSTTATMTVTDTLPPANILVGTPTPPQTSGNGTTTPLVWNLTVLTTTPTVITIPVQVDPNLSTGTTLENNVTVSYLNGENAHTFPTQTDQVSTLVTVPATTLQLTKTAKDLDGTPLLAGDSIRYVVQITNSNAFTAYNVVVTDTLPTDNVTCGSIAVSAGAATSCPIAPSTTITWTLGNMAINQSETMTIEVTINLDVADNTSIVNTASVSATNVTNPPTPPEVCPDGSTTTPCTGTSTPEPATTLNLTKTAEHGGGNPTKLEVGDTITYTVWVTNGTSNTAYGVVVTDTLSEYVTCQSITPNTGTTVPASCPATTIVWNVGTLAGDAGEFLKIIVTINDPEGLGQSITNTAVATGSNVSNVPPVPVVCPDGGTTLPCSPTPGYPDTTLDVSKTADADNPLAVGSYITYTVEVTNTGTYTAFDVTVTDNMSEYVTCQSASVSAGSTPSCPTSKPPNTLIWSAGDMAPSAVVSMVLIVKVDLSGQGQTITNTVSVTSTNVPTPPTPPVVCPDGSTPAPNCPEDPVLLTTTLELTKTAQADDPLTVGGNITYTVQVTNTGANTAYNVVVTDNLSPYVDCVSVTVISGPAGGASCPTPIVWTIAELPGNNTSYSMMILVQVNASGEGKSITNTVEITGINVVNPPTVPEICPDGSTPVGGVCPDNTIPEGGSPGVFLPIITKK